MNWFDLISAIGGVVSGVVVLFGVGYLVWMLFIEDRLEKIEERIDAIEKKDKGKPEEKWDSRIL